VEFFSPGTLFAETSSRKISEWDTREAVRLSEQILERHGAVPYGFRFRTQLVSDPVPDGEGGKLKVTPKCVEESPTYYLGGRVETWDEIVARADKREDIMRSNMRGNGWPLVVVIDRKYRSTLPFLPDQKIVEPDGTVVTRGDDVEYVAYREQVLTRWKTEDAQALARWKAERE
jgi:hypothetical protein